VYCGRTEAESGARLQLDHLVPRACGGTDEPSNLVVACARCNRAKSAMTLAEWQVVAKRRFGLVIDVDMVVATAALPLAA
jgi:5-methylcytosine-specific restriction endonuclease McrA